MARKLALAALVALLAALVAGWFSARAGDPAGGEDPAPLTLHLEADSQICTAGSFTEVRWEISGGAEPYEATLNGEPVDAPSGTATIACGEALDIPDWLRGVIQPLPIDVELLVRSADGDAVREHLTLQTATPFPARAVYLHSTLAGEADVQTALHMGVRKFRPHRARSGATLPRTMAASWRGRVAIRRLSGAERIERAVRRLET